MLIISYLQLIRAKLDFDLSVFYLVQKQNYKNYTDIWYVFSKKDSEWQYMYRVFNYIEESKLYFDYDVIYTPGIHENKKFLETVSFLVFKKVLFFYIYWAKEERLLINKDFDINGFENICITDRLAFKRNGWT